MCLCVLTGAAAVWHMSLAVLYSIILSTLYFKWKGIHAYVCSNRIFFLLIVPTTTDDERI